MVDTDTKNTEIKIKNLGLMKEYTLKLNPIFNKQILPLCTSINSNIVTYFINILKEFSEQQANIFGNFAERIVTK